MLLPVSGVIERVLRPKDFFDSNPTELEQVVRLVRASFGRDMDFQDVYDHITKPEEVYLLRNENLRAMASYSRQKFADQSALVVEGIAIVPEFQGRGIFRMITENMLLEETLICLRTQNPRMYRALQKCCSQVYPQKAESPVAIKAAILDFARHLGCNIDGFGVIKGYYGGLFYGQQPHHLEVDGLFQELGVDLHRGDGLLVIGKT